MTVRDADKILEIKAQIQEDILTYMDDFNPSHPLECMVDDLCQIVVENFENKNFHE